MDPNAALAQLKIDYPMVPAFEGAPAHVDLADSNPGAHFRELLTSYDAVFVVTPRLTNANLLDALLSVPLVGVVSSKETHLLAVRSREKFAPEVGRLRTFWGQLAARRVPTLPLPLADVGLFLHDKEERGLEQVSSLRVFGESEHRDVRGSFAVFANRVGDWLEPRCVWLGGFGPPLGPGAVLTGTEIARRYLIEYCYLLALSEPVPFNESSFSPEWSVHPIDAEDETSLPLE